MHDGKGFCMLKLRWEPEEERKKSSARYHGLWNQMLSLSWALINDESPLVSFKLFSYFKNCPNFRKESLRHTQHYTVRRAITVEKNWFNPLEQRHTLSAGVKLSTVLALTRWSARTFMIQAGVIWGQISLFPKEKQWCGLELYWCLLPCVLKRFPWGTWGAYRA